MRGTTRTRNVIRRTHRARRLWVSERILGDGATDLVEEAEDALGLVALKPVDELEPVEDRQLELPQPERDPESTG